MFLNFDDELDDDRSEEFIIEDDSYPSGIADEVGHELLMVCIFGGWIFV